MWSVGQYVVLEKKRKRRKGKYKPEFMGMGCAFNVAGVWLVW
jgi:hypothetical protein